MCTWMSSVIPSKDKFIQLKFIIRSTILLRDLKGLALQIRVPVLGNVAMTQILCTWYGNALESNPSGEEQDALQMRSWGSLMFSPGVVCPGNGGTYLSEARQRNCYNCFYARNSIALHWKDSVAPFLKQWKQLINSSLPLYKLTYEG